MDDVQSIHSSNTNNVSTTSSTLCTHETYIQPLVCSPHNNYNYTKTPEYQVNSLINEISHNFDQAVGLIFWSFGVVIAGVVACTQAIVCQSRACIMSCQVHSKYIMVVLLLQMNCTSFSIMLAPCATIDVLAEAQVLKSSTPEHVALYAHQALCHRT